ncbi:hypothetical protein D3C85_992370 [compost metagenome]
MVFTLADAMYCANKRLYLLKAGCARSLTSHGAEDLDDVLETIYTRNLFSFD